MSRYDEAMYGRRPWKINGEGPTRSGVGLSSEGAANRLAPRTMCGM